MPDQPAFGGGASETMIHPAVLVVLLFTILLVLQLPRRHVIVPFLLTTILVPGGQQLYIGGTHWYVLRILTLVGCLRLARSKFQLEGGLNGIDKAFILWAFYRAVAVMLEKCDGRCSGESSGVLAGRCFGGYFLLRYLIRNGNRYRAGGQSFGRACRDIRRVHAERAFS